MTSKPYTTYLLGAGASANALPVLSEMPRRMAEFAHWLELTDSTIFNTEQRIELTNQIKNSSAYGTPDTFAKMLHFSKSPETERFKWFLTLFFMHEQTAAAQNRRAQINSASIFLSLVKSGESTNSRPQANLDYRYPHLFASMFDEISFSALHKKNIRFVTWNYDIQIALFLKKVLNCPLTEAFEFLREPPSENNDRYKFQMQYFLNGSAIFKKNNSEAEAIPNFENDDTVIAYAKKMYQPRKSETNLLRYSWETKQQGEQYSKYIQEIQDLFEKSNRLIVIGYSFPTYNRLFDKTILSKFEGHVTIQSNESKNIQSRIQSVFSKNIPPYNSENKFHLIDDVSNFYIPDDLLV